MNDSFNETFLNNFILTNVEKSNPVSADISLFLNTNQNYSNSPYNGEYLKDFRDAYEPVEMYLRLLLCIFGITGNIFNVIVLTRKNMASPMNAILTGLAVTDMIALFLCTISTVHYFIPDSLLQYKKFSYGWNLSYLILMHFSIVIHTISIWMIIIVAMWRFIAFTFPFKAVSFCSMARAKRVMISIYIVCAIACVPQYLSYSILASKRNDRVTYRLGFSELTQMNEKLLEKVNFWYFSFITKFFPFAALIFLSIGLIRALCKMNLDRQKLKASVQPDPFQYKATQMVLVVLLLFLITEMPIAILLLLTGILDDNFRIYVSSSISKPMEDLLLLNHGINFIIYYFMCNQFKDAFKMLFMPKFLKNTNTEQMSQQTASTVI